MRKDIVFQVAQRFVSSPNAGFALPLTSNVHKKDGAIFAIALDGKCVQILWQRVFCPRAIAKIRRSVLPCGLFARPFGQSRPFSKIQTGKKKCVVDVAKI